MVRSRQSRLALNALLPMMLPFVAVVAFHDSFTLRQRQQHSPRLNINPTSLAFVTPKSSSSLSMSSVPSTTPTKRNPPQIALLPKLILDGIIEHSRNQKKEVSDATSSSPYSSSNTMGKLLPSFALFATTSPSKAVATAAFGTTTTAAAAASTMFAGSATAAGGLDNVLSVESQVLNDMSHIGIDLASFFIPSVLALRIAAIIGRICTISADYIPDHVIVPEEMVFQTVMLSIAFLGLLKSAFIPLAASMYNSNHTNTTPSKKDWRAYSSIFQPAGTSWSQYKALSVCGVLEWITLHAGDTVVATSTATSASNVNDTTAASPDHDEFMYWLYSGDLLVDNDHHRYVVSSTGSSSSSSSSKKSLHRLFGEEQLLQSLSGTNLNQQTSNRNGRPGKKRYQAHKNNDMINHNNNSYRVVVSSSDVTLLRINTKRLQIVMDLDPTLRECIRTMIIQGLEAKLQAQVQETTNILKSYNATSTSTVVVV